MSRFAFIHGVCPSPRSTRCITNLLNYRAVRTRARFPRGPSAAVLVPLFVGRSGDLYVVLSRSVTVLVLLFFYRVFLILFSFSFSFREHAGDIWN